MNIAFIIVGLLLVIYILNTVRKEKFSIMESIFWLIGSLIIIILAIFPNIIISLSKLVGIDYPPSFLFLLCAIFLVFISFRNTKVIAIQQEKIIELAEQVALLKINAKENDNKKSNRKGN